MEDVSLREDSANEKLQGIQHHEQPMATKAPLLVSLGLPWPLRLRCVLRAPADNAGRIVEGRLCQRGTSRDTAS
ncbi:hypothetical protein Nepgr_004791 [Nepenthes gracilis]|uniref:Uncharacterized protein n=1 Tax=Nepenthes gracilis TaxID=150966 RepID=A0AAD3XFS2_NEPGR|nr:hypothetical protein Nepgr_004791 [Nepenthes gracilis]